MDRSELSQGSYLGTGQEAETPGGSGAFAQADSLSQLGLERRSGGAPGGGPAEGPVRAEDPDAEADRNNLIGYHVEALDGEVGTVDEASADVAAEFIVVDTGAWIFGKRVRLPMSAIARVDRTERRVYLDQTRDQVRSVPEAEPKAFSGITRHGTAGGNTGGAQPPPPVFMPNHLQ